MPSFEKVDDFDLVGKNKRIRSNRLLTGIEMIRQVTAKSIANR
ncbi:hypothetical protein TNCV_2130691, partial [Trichonephila clavipes]